MLAPNGGNPQIYQFMELFFEKKSSWDFVGEKKEVRAVHHVT